MLRSNHKNSTEKSPSAKDKANKWRDVRDVSIRSLAPRVISLATPQKNRLLFGLFALIGASAINLSLPYIIKEILNKPAEINLPVVAISLILLFAVQSLFFYFRHFCFQAAGFEIVSKLRSDLFAAIVKQDISFFDQARVGDLISRLSSDAEIVRRALTMNISVVLRYAIQVLGGVVLMALISLKLTGLILLLIPICVLFGIYWGKKLGTFSQIMQEKLGIASATAEEAFSSIQTVKIFDSSNFEESRYNSDIDDALQAAIQRSKFASFFSSTMVFIIHAGIVFVLWQGGNLLVDNKLSVGDLTAFLLYCVIVAVSFGFLASAWEEFLQAVGASKRIFDIIDAKPEIQSPRAPKAFPRTAPQIKFNAVNFAYPSRENIKVLNSISLEIPAGETVALVGPSGAGKTTVASLIPRFYDPQSGTITLDGIALGEYDPRELRNNIAMVTQEPQVFSVSIKDNIRYAKADASDEEIQRAVNSAQLDDFISSLPEGLNTLVGDKGVQLSGGQKQRIAIARALLKNPSILILDEATSSLDSQNEHLVQQALTRLMHGRTSLVIAHRLSTVQHADRVYVINEGQVVQDGTHQTLVGAEGLYRNFVQYQLLQ